MKLTVLLLCALVAFVVADVDFQAQFNDYVVKFNKKYTSDEYDARFANFQESVKRVSFANTGKGAVYALNKFSDMSTEEFKNIVLMKETLGQVDVRNAPAFTPAADVPPTLDWREKGGVTPVKDQGQCGSCWAFSATEAIESANLIAGKVNGNISLSPQQIVDCDHDFVFGCNGGRPSAAYSYIIKAGGQEGTDNYPYTAKKGDCSFNSADIEASISTYQSIAHTEASLQQNLVNLGPLSICLDAAHWQDYSSGVLTPTECCPIGLCMLDHCVQLVGYNTTGNYWLVRNSWGTDWGNDGYIELAMGHNTCGLLDEVTWPSV